MYIMAKKKDYSDELDYLGWQDIYDGGFFKPGKSVSAFLGWQNTYDNGYFWTTKDTIIEIIAEGNNTKEHPFLFKDREQVKQFAKEVNINNYEVVKWDY